MRALLKQTDFVFFWAARFVATLAVQIQAVTIGWQVYTLARETGHNEGEGAFLLGMVGLAQFIPLFFLTLTAGETADRHDRRMIMTAAIGVDILCAAGLGLLAWSGHYRPMADLRHPPCCSGPAAPSSSPASQRHGTDAGAASAAAARHRLEFAVLAERLDHRPGPGRPAVRRRPAAGLRRFG